MAIDINALIDETLRKQGIAPVPGSGNVVSTPYVHTAPVTTQIPAPDPIYAPIAAPMPQVASPVAPPVMPPLPQGVMTPATAADTFLNMIRRNRADQIWDAVPRGAMTLDARRLAEEMRQAQVAEQMARAQLAQQAGAAAGPQMPATAEERRSLGAAEALNSMFMRHRRSPAGGGNIVNAAAKTMRQAIADPNFQMGLLTVQANPYQIMNAFTQATVGLPLEAFLTVYGNQLQGNRQNPGALSADQLHQTLSHLIYNEQLTRGDTMPLSLLPATTPPAPPPVLPLSPGPAPIQEGISPTRSPSRADLMRNLVNRARM